MSDTLSQLFKLTEAVQDLKHGQQQLVWDMREEEFKSYDAQRDQERKLRTRRR